MPAKSREHVRPLPGIPDADILVRLETEHRQLIGYAVVLRVFESGRPIAVRTYDYVPAHGEHHLHRYTREGAKRQPPEVLPYPTIQAGFDEAVKQLRATANEIIDSWRRQRPAE